MGFFDRTPEDKLIRLFESGTLVVNSDTDNNRIQQLAERSEIKNASVFATTCQELTDVTTNINQAYAKCYAMHRGMQKCESNVQINLINYNKIPTLKPHLEKFGNPTMFGLLGLKTFFCNP